jgi:hypothetical protein
MLPASNLPEHSPQTRTLETTETVTALTFLETLRKTQKSRLEKNKKS